MTSKLALVAVPTADTPGICVHLHNEKRTYVFGRITEGTQRAYGPRGMHWGGTEHVFLTGAVNWAQNGGLIGFLLTVGGAIETAKAEAEKINQERRRKGKEARFDKAREVLDVHGGDNLAHALAASRSVIYRQPIQMRVHETRHDPRAIDPNNLEPDWEDDGIKVWKIPVQRERSSSPVKRAHSPPSADGRDGAEGALEDDAPKPEVTLSDPELSALIVQNIMFAGVLNNRTVLKPTKLGEVKSTDVAVIIKNGAMQRYQGPYTSDGAELDRPDATAYVFPEAGQESVDAGSDQNGLELRAAMLPPTTYSETSMCYLVKSQERRGTFNPQAAKKYGVATHNFGRLTRGESVEGRDGVIVTPEMVLGAPKRGNGFIIADIASSDFIEPFLARPEWSKAELLNDIVVMYWYLMPGLAMDPRIQKFVQNHSQFRHVFCSEDTCPNMIVNPGPALHQVRLRRLDPKRFPLLQFDNTVKYPAPPADSPIKLARAGDQLVLMPRLHFADGESVDFPDLTSSDATFIDADILRMAREATKESAKPEFLARVEEEEKDFPNRDAEVIALGTGSSIPSKYRNVSSTLVRVPGHGNYLLDCGEGTLGQLRRLYSPEELVDVLRNLRLIVISHMHADHHMGTTTLVKAWYEQALRDGRADATLGISCIVRFRQFLHEMSQVEDIGFHRLRFPNCPLPGRAEYNHVDAADLGPDNFGLASIKRVPVDHCFRAFATQIELTSGLRVAYSGDCRPSDDFARACRGAHLLVHECTFGDDMAAHAAAKKHSTISEALLVARDMEARRTLLTHFSQRYIKAETPRNDSVRKGTPDGPVLLALDNMAVRLGDFREAELYKPAIQLMMDRLSSSQGPNEDVVA